MLFFLKKGNFSLPCSIHYIRVYTSIEIPSPPYFRIKKLSYPREKGEGEGIKNRKKNVAATLASTLHYIFMGKERRASFQENQIIFSAIPNQTQKFSVCYLKNYYLFLKNTNCFVPLGNPFLLQCPIQSVVCRLPLNFFFRYYCTVLAVKKLCHM